MSLRSRPAQLLLAAAVGVGLAAAATIPLGLTDTATPQVPHALALLVVVLTAVVAGPWVGLFVAGAAWALFFFLDTEQQLRVVFALPIWLAIAVAAGLAGDRWRRSERARRDAEEKLDVVRRDGDVKYRSLAENAPIVTLLTTAGDRSSLAYVSPQVEAMLGYSPAELRAEPELLSRLVHPEDRERVLATRESIETNGVPVRDDYRLVARDGRIVWVRAETSIVRDAAGEPAYTQTLLVDESDRRRAGEEHERLRAAERAAASVGIVRQGQLDLLGETGEILGASTNARASIQRVTDLVVRDLADWCTVETAGEDGDLERLAVASAARSTAPPPEPADTARLVVRTGRKLLLPGLVADDEEPEPPEGTASLICVPVRSRGRSLGALTLARAVPGPVYGADELSVAEDLAGRIGVAIDRMQLHREVEERADAERVLTYVADAILLVDRTGIVRLWNPAAEHVTGIPASELVGYPAQEKIGGWREAVESVPVSTSPDPGRLEVMVPLEGPNGERWVSISGVRFFGGTVYAFRDVTEVRQLEQLKADFIATASHELRTPLAAVYGAAQTLLRHDFALDEAGRVRFVSLIAEESDRLGRIVNEILLANQLDAGRVDLGTEAFDPKELVERVVDAARVHAPSTITFERVIPPHVPPVTADRDKVRQVLVNLIENAVKYSPGGGRVEIGIEARERSSPESVVFYVKDEGLGIPQEEQARIFEKFYRVDPQMTRGVGGTGLGLYICSELVSRMGGQIWVESKEGEGSTFLLELPAEAVSFSRPLPGLARAPEPESESAESAR